MACQFPGSDGYGAFWKLLARGGNAITEIPAERWPTAGFFSPNLEEPNCSVSKWGGFIERADEFDHRFFNISPREARNMDPQQRLLLQEAWRCVEDAAVPLSFLQRKRTGVYVGFMQLDYAHEAQSPGVETDSYACSGNFSCLLANRISHVLDLRGPSFAIDTACSSSLAALHQARNALISGECDYALVAGVSLNLLPWKYISFSKSRMLSPDGKCKVFGQEADGYVPGEGVGVILLQRADAALEEGNPIHGLVLGSAVNHGGRSVSLTAPRLAAQREVIEGALASAGVPTETLTYVEAHGTGTSLGDPIELEALTQAFGRYTQAKQFCRIGSVKANIGHLEAAAGIAGVIKVLLMMRHRQIPPQSVGAPNPLLDFAESPFLLTDELAPWSERILRAGVSSFGFGGVNSHVVLEEAPPGKKAQTRAKQTAAVAHPFLLSAKSAQSLEGLVEKWLQLEGTDEFERLDVGDICGTLRVAREQFAYRAGCCVRTKDDIFQFLKRFRASESLHETNSGSWELLFGSAAKVEPKRLRKFFDMPRFRAAWETISEMAPGFAKGGPACDPIKRALAWRRNHAEAFELLLLLTMARSAAAVLPEPSLVSGDGIGFLAALCFAGTIDLPTAVRLLEKPSGSLVLKQPRAPWADPSSGKTERPAVIDRKYIEGLIAGMAIPANESKRLVERARALQRQLTFRKFLESWRGSLEQAGWRWEELFEPGQADAIRSSETIRLVAFGDALRRLNRKWDLPNRVLPKDPRFAELLELLALGVLLPAEFAGGLSADQATLEKLALVADERFQTLPRGAALPLLKSLARPERVIRNPAKWLLEIRRLEGKRVSAGPAIVVGELKSVPAAACRLMVGEDPSDELQETLVHLWLSGIPVRWREYSDETKFERVRLPVYRFEGERFWIRESTLAAPLAAESLNPGPIAAPESVSETASAAVKPAEHRETIASAVTQESLKQELLRLLAGILQVEHREIDERADLRDYGLESIALTEYAEAISQRFAVACDPVQLFEHPTLEKLTAFLLKNFGEKISTSNTAEPQLERNEVAVEPPGSVTAVATSETEKAAGPITNEPIAIIGMAGKFPGSPNLEVFWENLVAGKDLVSQLPDQRWPSAGASHEEKTASCPAGGFIDGVGTFDAGFFRISPKEAELMDPQQRWMLELSWHAFEDAGYRASAMAGSSTGVFVGVCNNDYQQLIEAAAPTEPHLASGTSFSMLANRLSYFFDLHGPSLAIDTACSSSLVAIHQAICALRAGQCELALAGGVNLCWLPHRFISYSKAGMLSKSGRCRTFDAAADGYVRGEGAGVVLLKPLSHAIRDGDPIRAVIRAAAVNHGGKANSLTAPNPEAQAELLVRSYEEARVAPERVGYIEVHGTGTVLGDPIEVAGLKTAFAELFRRAKQPAPGQAFCGLGSVKTNIGHLEAAAGIAGLIKVVLALEHRLLPASLHCERLNPHISLANSPFFVLQKSTPWAACHDEAGRMSPRFAGVSSFGFGGANAHVVLQEFNATIAEPESERATPELILLSARNEERLRCAVEQLKAWLASVGTEARMPDLAHTLQTGREAFDCRLAVRASSREELLGKLEEFLAGVCPCDGVWSATIQRQNRLGQLEGGAEEAEFVRKLFTAGQLDKLARFWVSGSEIDWASLYAGRGRRRISLPGYCFAKDRFWIVRNSDTPTSASDPAGYVTNAKSILRAEASPRKAQPAERNGAEQAQPGAEALEGSLRKIISETLKIEFERIDPEIHFSEMGMDSILLADLVRKIEQLLGVNLNPSVLLEHPTVAGLAAELRETQINRVQSQFTGAHQAGAGGSMLSKSSPEIASGVRQDGVPAGSKAIAVIGMNCRFPGADTKEDFWANLRGGRCSIREVPRERWDIERFYSPTPVQGKSISKWGGFVEGIELFDPAFFNISQQEARQVDPLVRLFLEVSVQALRDAGYEQAELSGGRVGVFVGSRRSDYDDRIETFTKNTITGIGQNFIAAQASHFLNFRGPSMVVDSACSSSVASIHLACRSLLAGESDLALAGGVDVLLDEKVYLLLTEANALSPTGCCRAFDLRADGYVPGEGAGVLLLKPLDRAVQDGDQIYGIILSSALNNDGRTMGITTPNLEAQQEVIETALAQAGVEPGSITMLEANGTGTMLGDPIELRALSQVFRKRTAEKQFCAIGSVKTNIGHLHTAAGIASVMKVLLSLAHAEIPPTLHCDTPNPRFDFAGSPFFPNTHLRRWAPKEGVRRAGVTTFGFGGTNGHIILEEFLQGRFAEYQPRRKSLPYVTFAKQRHWWDRKPPVERDELPEFNFRSAPRPFLVLKEEAG